MLLRALAAALVTALLAPAVSAQVPFAVDNYGPSCGPIASGVVTPVGATHRFAFTASQMMPHTYVMLIVGVNDVRVPIQFGHDCLLLTELAFTQVHMTSAIGDYTWSHAFSHDFQGWARVQFAEIVFDALGQLFVRTTNGVYMHYTG